MRQTDHCRNCGDVREIVAHGLCSKCYMRAKRATERRAEPEWLHGPDRTQSKAQRDLNRMRVNFSKMVALLDETPISNAVLPAAQYETVKAILIAGIERICGLQKLTANPESQLTVNSNDPDPEPNKPENVVEFSCDSETGLTVNPEPDDSDEDDEREPEGFDGPY